MRYLRFLRIATFSVYLVLQSIHYFQTIQLMQSIQSVRSIQFLQSIHYIQSILSIQSNQYIQSIQLIQLVHLCMSYGSYIAAHKFIWTKSWLQPKYLGQARVSKVGKINLKF